MLPKEKDGGYALLSDKSTLPVSQSKRPAHRSPEPFEILIKNPFNDERVFILFSSIDYETNPLEITIRWISEVPS